MAALARAASAELRSMGVALGACTVPAVGQPGFQLADDEVEWGLGIHGEQGVERGSRLDADATLTRLLDTLIEDSGYATGTRLALLDAPAQARAWPGDGRVPEAPSLLLAPRAASEAATAMRKRSPCGPLTHDGGCGDRQFTGQ